MNLKIIAFLLGFLPASIVLPDELFILKYGESLYPAELTNRKSTGKIPMDWLFFLYCRDGKNILFDSGTFDTNSIRNFSINKFIKPNELLKSQMIIGQGITDIFITHSHFDHVGGIFLFPDANLHIHPLEYKKIRNSNTYKKYSEYFKNLESQNRVFFYSTETEVYQFIKVVPTLGHTQGSLSFEIMYRGYELIFVGDECYYVEECKLGIGTSPGALYDTKMNKKYIEYLVKKNRNKMRIITFHDPDLLHSFQMDETQRVGRFLIGTE